MAKISLIDRQKAVVEPQTVIEKIKPGMSIFLGTAVAEPRTMIRHLMNSNARNLEDLELIQRKYVPNNLFFRTDWRRNFSCPLHADQQPRHAGVHYKLRCDPSIA